MSIHRHIKEKLLLGKMMKKIRWQQIGLHSYFLKLVL